MPIIRIEQARVGMRLDKDVYSAKGVKLAARGVVLNARQINFLINSNIRTIDVLNESETQSPETETESATDLSGESQVGSREKDLLNHILLRFPMFEKLSREHMELLMANFKIVKYDARTLLFSKGDPGDTFFIVLKGAIKIYMEGTKGTNKILTVCRTGDSFGELSLLDGKPRSASAKTLQKTEMLIITQESLMNVLQSNFDIARMIMREIIGHIRETHQQIEDLKIFSTRTRVIKSLIKLANSFGKRSQNAIEVDLPLELEELAQMVGIPIWELHNVLTDLERIELVRVHANYFSLDLKKLRALS